MSHYMFTSQTATLWYKAELIRSKSGTEIKAFTAETLISILVNEVDSGVSPGFSLQLNAAFCFPGSLGHVIISNVRVWWEESLKASCMLRSRLFVKLPRLGKDPQQQWTKHIPSPSMPLHCPPAALHCHAPNPNGSFFSFVFFLSFLSPIFKSGM